MSNWGQQQSWGQQPQQQQQSWGGGGGQQQSWGGGGSQQQSWGGQASQGGNWQQQQAPNGAASGGGSWGGQQPQANAAWGQQQPQQQAAGGWGQQQPAAPQQAAPQQAAPAQAQAGQLEVTGCTHATIGSIVRGIFNVVSENHTKPVYQRTTQVSGLEVMIYFWDTRDGANQAGWWFGPKVGGEQVWAYNPELNTRTPPKTGWQVPYGGPVDATFVIEEKGAAASAGGWGQQQPNAQQTAWQQPQQQQQSWGNQGGQANVQAAIAETQRKQREAELQMQQQALKAQQDALKQQQEQQAERARQQHLLQQQSQAQNWQQKQMIQKQLQSSQMDEMKKRQEENKKRLEEARLKQQQEQARKMEEMQKLREAAQKKQQEEQARKMKELQDKKEAEAQKQAAIKATFAVRRLAQRIRLCTVENFESTQQEIQEELAREIEACGDQAERMQEEYVKAYDATRKRVEEALERKRIEDEKKAEIERIKKEREERAKARLEELIKLVETAEAEQEQFKDTAKEMDVDDSAELTSAQVEAKWTKVTSMQEICKATHKTCTGFFREHGAELKDRAPDEGKATFQQLLVRIQESQKAADAAMSTAKATKDKAMKKALAHEKSKAIEKVFKKYDKDKDGALSEKEVLAFAKGEHDVKLEKDLLAWVMRSLVAEGSKGVKLDCLHRLKCVIGSQREVARDKVRRAERVEKEAVIESKKDELKAIVAASEGKVGALRKETAVAEEKVAGIQKKARVLSAADVFAKVDESDDTLKKAKGAYDKIQQEIDKIAESVDPKYQKDLKAYLATTNKKLNIDMHRIEARIKRVEKVAERYREDAKIRQVDELDELRRKALKIIRYSQGSKKLSVEDLFGLFDNGSGAVDDKSWLAFFETAESAIKELKLDVETKENGAKEDKPAEEATKDEAPADEPEKTEEAEGETKEGGEEKQENGNAEESTADAEKEEKPAEPSKEDEPDPVIEQVDLSTDELSRLFNYLDEESEGSLSKELFLRNVRWTMKVVKDTAMTPDITVKGAKALRKLDPKELVEVLKGPMREPAMKLSRVYVKALKDDLQGWVSVCSNQGTVFLEDCGARSLYKVMRLSVMTDAFDQALEIDGEGHDDPSRRLRAGTVLEVREPPKKHEASGLTRMKCKVRSSDGSLGWVTTRGKQGKVFCKEYL